MDIMQEAEIAVMELQERIVAEREQAIQEWENSRKPNKERLRALGMID